MKYLSKVPSQIRFLITFPFSEFPLLSGFMYREVRNLIVVLIWNRGGTSGRRVSCNL